MLCRAHTALAVLPPCASRKIPTICSSLCRFFFIWFCPLYRTKLHSHTVLFFGVRAILSPEKHTSSCWILRANIIKSFITILSLILKRSFLVWHLFPLSFSGPCHMYF